jgi:DNA-binding transcriptional regulator YiaG
VEGNIIFSKPWVIELVKPKISKWKNPEENDEQEVDTRSPAGQVANIRDVFAINMSDFASVLGVTRPIAYAWLEGQEPNAETAIRIQRLSRAADKVKCMNITHLDKLVHRPISNGRSLLDILKADENPSEALATLKAIAEKEDQTRREPKGSGKHLRSFDDILGEFSVAIYRTEQSSL